jgi:hypothetical protein
MNPPDSLPRSAAPRGFFGVATAACLLFSLFTLVRWDAFRHVTVLHLWQVFDWQDIHVYFESSRWIVGGGTLYRDVPSEYPLLANLIFAAVELLSRVTPVLADAYDRFAWVWVSVMLPVWFLVLHRLWTRFPRPALFLWLTPASLFFGLYRFDAVAVLLSLLCVEAVYADRLRRAALWLGLVTALKGYSLFLLPALAVYVWRRRGFREAVAASAVNLAPFLIANLVTLAFSGVDGLLFAYRFHAARWLNGESTWDAIAYLTGPAIRDWLPRFTQLPPILEAACALIAAGFRPREPRDLMRAFLFATTGFISFSVFYSPQFVLWLVPFAADFAWPLASWLVVATSWLTFAYFPVAFFKRLRHPRLFELTVSAVAALRLLLMAITAFAVGRVRAERRAAVPAPAAGAAR